MLVPWIDLDDLVVLQSVNEPLNCCLLTSSEATENTSKDLEAAEAVLNWLAKHQIEAVLDEDEVIVIQKGLAYLRPPHYNNIEATNVIVLDR